MLGMKFQMPLTDGLTECFPFFWSVKDKVPWPEKINSLLSSLSYLRFKSAP